MTEPYPLVSSMFRGGLSTTKPKTTPTTPSTPASRRRNDRETTASNAPKSPVGSSLAERIEQLTLASRSHSRERAPRNGKALVMPDERRSVSEPRSRRSISPRRLSAAAGLWTPQPTKNSTPAAVEWPDSDSWAKFPITDDNSQPSEKENAVSTPRASGKTKIDDADSGTIATSRSESLLSESKLRALMKEKGFAEESGSIVCPSPSGFSSTSVNRRIDAFLTKVSNLASPRSQPPTPKVKLLTRSLADLVSSSSDDSNPEESEAEANVVARKIREVAKAGGLPLGVINHILNSAVGDDESSSSSSSATDSTCSSEGNVMARSDSSTESEGASYDEFAVERRDSIPMKHTPTIHITTRTSTERTEDDGKEAIPWSGLQHSCSQLTFDESTVRSLSDLRDNSRWSCTTKHETSSAGTKSRLLDDPDPYPCRRTGRLGIEERVDVFQPPWLQDPASSRDSLTNKNQVQRPPKVVEQGRKSPIKERRSSKNKATEGPGSIGSFHSKLAKKDFERPFANNAVQKKPSEEFMDELKTIRDELGRVGTEEGCSSRMPQQSSPQVLRTTESSAKSILRNMEKIRATRSFTDMRKKEETYFDDDDENMSAEVEEDCDTDELTQVAHPTFEAKVTQNIGSARADVKKSHSNTSLARETAEIDRLLSLLNPMAKEEEKRHSLILSEHAKRHFRRRAALKREGSFVSTSSETGIPLQSQASLGSRSEGGFSAYFRRASLQRTLSLAGSLEETAGYLAKDDLHCQTTLSSLSEPIAGNLEEEVTGGPHDPLSGSEVGRLLLDPPHEEPRWGPKKKDPEGHELASFPSLCSRRYRAGRDPSCFGDSESDDDLRDVFEDVEEIRARINRQMSSSPTTPRHSNNGTVTAGFQRDPPLSGVDDQSNGSKVKVEPPPLWRRDKEEGGRGKSHSSSQSTKSTTSESTPQPRMARTKGASDFSHLMTTNAADGTRLPDAPTLASVPESPIEQQEQLAKSASSSIPQRNRSRTHSSVFEEVSEHRDVESYRTPSPEPTRHPSSPPPLSAGSLTREVFSTPAQEAVAKSTESPESADKSLETFMTPIGVSGFPSRIPDTDSVNDQSISSVFAVHRGQSNKHIAQLKNRAAQRMMLAAQEAPNSNDLNLARLPLPADAKEQRRQTIRPKPDSENSEQDATITSATDGKTTRRLGTSKADKGDPINKYWQTFSEVKTMGSFDSLTESASVIQDYSRVIRAKPSPLYEAPARRTSPAHKPKAPVQADHKPMHQRKSSPRPSRDAKPEPKPQATVKTSPKPNKVKKPQKQQKKDNSGAFIRQTKSMSELSQPITENILYVMGPLLSGDTEDTSQSEEAAKADVDQPKGCFASCGDGSGWFGLPGLCGQ